jgi:hypothetical protein
VCQSGDNPQNDPRTADGNFGVIAGFIFLLEECRWSGDDEAFIVKFSKADIAFRTNGVAVDCVRG